MLARNACAGLGGLGTPSWAAHVPNPPSPTSCRRLAAPPKRCQLLLQLDGADLHMRQHCELHEATQSMGGLGLDAALLLQLRVLWPDSYVIEDGCRGLYRLVRLRAAAAHLRGVSIRRYAGKVSVAHRARQEDGSISVSGR